MKKIFAVLAVALALGGCAKEMQNLSSAISAAQNFKITQGQVDTARNSYNGFVLAPLRRYALLPRCRTNTESSVFAISEPPLRQGYTIHGRSLDDRRLGRHTLKGSSRQKEPVVQGLV